MNRALVSCVIVVGLCVGFAVSAEPAPGPAKNIAELAPLNYWAGRHSGEVVTPSRAKGTALGEWVHDGRFLRQTWALEASEGSPKMSGTVMMTYDPGKKLYRSWTFHSNGSVLESRGTWDAKSRTMKWHGRDPDNGSVTVTEASFAEDGAQTWKIVVTDAGGKTVYEARGQNTPQEK